MMRISVYQTVRHVMIPVKEDVKLMIRKILLVVVVMESVLLLVIVVMIDAGFYSWFFRTFVVREKINNFLPLK